MSTKLVQELVGLLEDRQWEYEERTNSSFCQSCQGEPFEHAPDCPLKLALDRANAWLEECERNRPLAIRGRCGRCRAEISERDSYQLLDYNGFSGMTYLLCEKCGDPEKLKKPKE